MLADELKKLDELHKSGAISDQEYTAAKSKLLSGQDAGASAAPMSTEQQTRLWAMFLHLALLLSVVGLIVTIVIWQTKKAELPGIDAHGKNAVNWIISALIYFVVCLALSVIIIGIPMMFALGLLGIIFPIIAGIKANNGEVWKYPLSITFLK